MDVKLIEGQQTGRPDQPVDGCAKVVPRRPGENAVKSIEKRQLMPSTGHPGRQRGDGSIDQPRLAATDTAPQEDAAPSLVSSAPARAGPHLGQQLRQLPGDPALRRVRLDLPLRKMAKDGGRIALSGHAQPM